MRDYIKRQVSDWYTTTATPTLTTPITTRTTTTTKTTTTTAANPITIPPLPEIANILKKKMQSLGDWCKNCLTKAKDYVRDALGIEDDVYGSDDDVGSLVDKEVLKQKLFS